MRRSSCSGRLDNRNNGGKIGGEGRFYAIASHNVLRIIVGYPDLRLRVLPGEHLERQIEPDRRHLQRKRTGNSPSGRD